MLKVPRKLLGSEPGPAPLPENLLPDLVRRKPILLCLDYDGTISEIAREPNLARPVHGAIEALRALTAHSRRVSIALVSGRTINDLRAIVPAPRGIALAGVHGLELFNVNGRYEEARGIHECREDFERVRLWLDRNLPANAGFVVEDKGIALALHYRQAAKPIAQYVRDSFEQFIRERTTLLEPRHGKMVLEAMPKIATKATAVRTLWQQVGHEFEPVYFGDDLTDEDAFTELAEHGITVLVGNPRRSAAHYRVHGPAEVVRVLNAVAAALDEVSTRRNAAEPNAPVKRSETSSRVCELRSK